MSIYKGSKLLAGWNKTDIATDAEFADGESNSKACSVKQTQDAVSNASRLPLFTPARFPFLANDVSWLRSDTFSWHSGAVYVSAYNLLKEQYEDISSIEEKDVIGDITITYKRTPNKMKICAPDQMTQIQKLWDAENVAWYFILDMTNAQFKLPRSKYGFSGFGDNVGDYNTESLPNISQTSNWRIGVQDGQDFSYEKLPLRKNTTAWVGATSGTWEGDGVEAFGVDASLSSPAYKDNGQVQERSTSSYLYFYVGRFDQKAIINTAGIKTEELNKKADADLSNLSVTGLNKLGGLDILSIVLMPLGIDENENKYRYLNGQIIIQDQFPEFTKKLKSKITKFPGIFTTETNWQAEKTNSKLGQCGKFVVDDTAGTIRLPCVINAQGLVDLTLIGGIRSESLPDATYYSEAAWGVASGDATRSLVASKGGYEVNNTGKGLLVATRQDATSTFAYSYGKLSASNSVYQNNASVQQEAIQYPYCIVVNTGVDETERPINNYQINNVYSFGMSQYYKGTMNNNSWLKSAGQWNDGTVYTGMYQWLIEQMNADVSGFVASTATYTDYDFVINTTDQTFRLPVLSNRILVEKKEDVDSWYNLYSDGWLEQGGGIQPTTVGALNIQYLKAFKSIPYVNMIRHSNYSGSATQVVYWCNLFTERTTNGFQVYADSNNSDYIIWHAEGYADIPQNTGYNLYYYIGDTLQNASLINVARIEEKLTSVNAASRGYVVESYRNGTDWYRIYSDGWIEQGGSIAFSSSTYIATFNFIKPFSTIPTVFTGIISNPTGGAYTGNKEPTTSSVTVFAGGWLDDGRIAAAPAYGSKVSVYACGY